MIKPWAGPYIGIPYKIGGRSRQGLDCGGLVIMVYRDELGIDLPDTVADIDYDSDDVGYSARAVDKHRKLFDQVNIPKPFDVALFTRFGIPSHIGVVLDKANFLHCSKRVGVCIERFESPVWVRRFAGFYRPICQT